MDTHNRHRDPGRDAADRYFDDTVSYEDESGTVVCDRYNPTAWIRSTKTRPCTR